MFKDAVIDETGQYRYLLTRRWDINTPSAVFIMLNPSTADATEDDPTIRRCIKFAISWGFGSIKVVNVFAYRATDPKELLKAGDPVGPENQKYITDVIADAGIVVAAWGASGLKGRWPYKRSPYQKIFEAAKAANVSLYCLGITKDGHPKHPLYIKGDTRPKLLSI